MSSRPDEAAAAALRRASANAGPGTVITSCSLIVDLEGLNSAADFYLDRKAKKLLVPDMLAGTLIFVDIK